MTIIIIFICLIIIACLVWRKQKGFLEEKDIVGPVITLIALMVGVWQFENKYIEVEKIKNDIRGIENNIKNIAERIFHISRDGNQTKINGSLTIEHERR